MNGNAGGALAEGTRQWTGKAPPGRLILLTPEFQSSHSAAAQQARRNQQTHQRRGWLWDGSPGERIAAHGECSLGD